ncbi:MAG: peptidylprolyl isomerase [Clostridia bacterium]|nr:peptidylprolyl isomerase [Clostridia bacterium]
MFNLNFKKTVSFVLAIVCVLALASCAKTNVPGNAADEDTVLTVGGRQIGSVEYNYFFNIQKDFMDNGDASFWADNAEGIEKLKADTLNSLAQFEAIRLLSAEKDVTVTDEQTAQNEAAVQSMLDQYGEEELTKMLAEQHLTLDLYKEILHTLALDSNLYDALAQNGELGVDDETVKTKIKEEYVRAMHILYADEATAQGVLEEAKAATDEEFYELAQSAEDPGMVGNTNGYVFTYNQMVKSFEDATYALEVGQTSDLVKSDYGYHIIRKLDLSDEYIDEHYTELAQNDLINAYYTYVDDFAAELAAKAEFTELYDTFTVDTAAVEESADESVSE